MMQTNKFLTSIVFADGAETGRAMTYKEVITSELPCNVFAHRSDGNLAFFQGCHFTVYLKKNSDVISAEDVQNKKHVVVDDQKNYVLDAYLQVDGDVLANHISLVSTLPKGTVMNSMENETEIDMFVFSGFSVILFDVKKESF